MRMEPVTSSNVEAIGYDHDEQILYIKFKSGKTYRYYSCPERIYLGLKDALSKGKYFNQNIKHVLSYELTEEA